MGRLLLAVGKHKAIAKLVVKEHIARKGLPSNVRPPTEYRPKGIRLGHTQPTALCIGVERRGRPVKTTIPVGWDRGKPNSHAVRRKNAKSRAALGKSALILLGTQIVKNNLPY